MRLTTFLYIIIPGLVLLYSAGCSERQAPEASDSTTNSPITGATNPHAAGSPFMPSHDRPALNRPSGENLSPTYHATIESTRLRLEESPGDTALVLQMAHLSQDGHQLEAAVDYYRRYLDLHPAGIQAWLDLTKCLGELNQWDEALEATQELLSRDPGNISALYNLGAIQANAGDYAAAREAWETVAAQRNDSGLQMRARESLERLAAMNQ